MHSVARTVAALQPQLEAKDKKPAMSRINMSRDVWSKKKANASGDNGWAERGGYMAAKVSKLDEQFKLDAPREKQKDGTCSTIFSGVSIYVNGYTEPSADELRRLMMLHGGQFHIYYSRSKTSHIIANNLPNSKIKELRGEKITPEMAGPSHQKLHLPQRSMQRSVLNNESQNNSLPPPNHSRLYPDNIQPQSVQQSSAARLINPQPSHLASTYLNTDPRHRSPSHTHLLSNPSPTKPPLKPPLSPLQTPQANLQHQRAGQQQPHSNSSYNSSCKEVELKINGFLQTSFDVMSHSKLKEMQECGKADPLPQVVKEAHLTNGHSHLANGALKPEDLLSPAKPSDDTELPQCRVKSSHDKPHSPPGPFQTKPDPYEFPQSPPKQSEQSVVSLKQSSSHEANEKRLKPPPPTYQEALKATETHLLPKQLHPSRPVNSHPEKTPLSPAHRSLSHSPVRLNGSHHNAFSSASLNSTNITSKPHHPTEKSPSPSKSSAQLMAQTGGLISEYYSHSRLHQISTWRSGFSEYVSTHKCQIVYFSRGHGLFLRVCGDPTSTRAPRPVAVTSNRGHGRVPLRPGAQPQLESQYYQRKHALPEMEDEDLDRSPSEDSPVPHTNGVDQDSATLSRAEIASCTKQLCPSLQSVPYDFEAYKEVALTMYETLAGYTHDIEALSCDELLIDGSALLAELRIDPQDLARTIRANIKEKTGCCASVGMGSNILLARLATRKAKPDGQHLLKPEEVDDFIRELPVTSLPGVGPVMGRKLAGMGVRSCGDLQQVSLSQLQKKFGPRTGQTLFRFCRGLDERPVRYEKERKSVSAEMNYNIRFTKVDEAESFLNNLSMEVQKRLQDAGLRGRRVTLKVMVRKAGAPLEPAKYGGHGICDNLARTVMLAQSTDSGQLIAAAVIKLFHAMKLQVQEMRGIGIQVQLLDGHHSGPQDSAGTGSRSIKQMFLRQGKFFPKRGPSSSSTPRPLSSPEPVPGTSRDQHAGRHTPKNSRARLNFSIEIPSPSQDLEPPSPPSPMPPAPPPPPPSVRSRPPSPPRPAASALYTPPAGTLLLQLPDQPDSPGIVLELPHFSQVDPDVFAALPKELQDELKNAYNRVTHVQPQAKISVEQKNPLLQLKQPGVGVGRVKRRYKRKNAGSPVKKGPSPVKRQNTTNSPAKTLPPPLKPREPINTLKTENGPSTSNPKADIPESKFIPRPAPVLAGAYDMTDIRTLLREWVTTITEPMEEDILQVVKFCTDLIEDKDLEKLDLIIKYMKRLMQQSLESVWSMAFDFILDNVQLVVQQTYGSTLKVA
ncbi:hypothetical protein F7725_002261 [Dissostichus mawsoni]|uniref:DNA repair protein REV1 n=1 Tax=Dissostichus mawsoni TaxID=36200 RepID=A0A7J5Y1V8_DISMA|nr:hypothetical protein F7725_002261 [Dissostichus mawsoni]